jgi:hypothetical protein
MATSSILTEEQMTLVKPDEGIMINREENAEATFDRQALRQEFAPVRQLDAGTRYVEEGGATFLSAESDMPGGPTGIGESFGNVELVRVVGGTQYIPRYTHGFTIEDEDREVDDSFVSDMRDGILELFDVQADLAFLQGLDHEDGTAVFKGVFEWLEDNMPSGNVIDCSGYDPSSGDLGGVQANIITQKAYEKIDKLYMDTTWDIAAAKPVIWAYWNQYGTFDGAIVQSQWELVSADENEQAVGVQRRLTVPPKIGVPTAPGESGSLTFSIDFPSRTNDSYSSPLSDAKDDVMYLIPNHGGDFYELYEQGSPDVRGPLEKDGFRERFEYKWRAGVVYGQNGHKTDTDIARDVVKLENVTALFDNA